MLRKYWWVLAAITLLLVVCFSFFKNPITDYLVWRYMVTFNVPVTPVDDYQILINKSHRTLTLSQSAVIVASYPIAISVHGSGPRTTWSDELTPEGTFLIASMQYESRFGPRQMLLETTSQSLTDYLNQYGAEGKNRLAQFESSHGKLDTIWETYDFNKVYPDFPMWNDILIHGGGVASDWTWGCVALDDPQVIELFTLLHSSRNRGLGVPVTIIR